MSKVPQIRDAQNLTVRLLRDEKISREDVVEILEKYGVKQVGRLQIGQIPPFIKEIESLIKK